MDRRRVAHHPEKPWKPNVARWLPFLREGQPVKIVGIQQDEPTKGWQLWDWQTTEDRPQ